jgi:hypothetical protein
MPKAGKYTYPFYSINFVVEKLKKAYDAIKDTKMQRKVVAEVLGMEESGGGFSYVTAAWEDYGLTKNEDGIIIITSLGQRAILGEEGAKIEAVNRIPLFRELKQAYGDDAKADNVATFLRNKANLDPIKARTPSSNIAKIYMKMSKYINPADAFANDFPGTNFDRVMQKPAGVNNKMASELKSDTLEIKVGGVYIQIPSGNKEGIRLAKAALDFMEKYEPAEEKKTN